MNKITTLILTMFISVNAYATTITTPTTWSNGDTVTAAKLNGNQNAITTVVNGNLDNTNMATGYKLFQVAATLPSPGNQGAVAFLTSNNTLNLDNGASWQATITPTGTLATGQLPYYNGGWQLFSPGGQYLPIISNGTSSLPSYQVLSSHGGGTGQDSSAWTSGDYVYMSSTGTWGHTPLGHGSQMFTSSGTFTAPTGVTKVYLTLLGGGGGGGGTGGVSTNGGGGGAGGYQTINYPYTVVPGNAYSVVIGGGGTGGASTGTNGATGTNSSFDSTVIALGGTGGGGTTGAGAGSGGTNVSNLNGLTSTAGGINFGNGNGTAGNAAYGGGGGGTLVGAGAAGPTSLNPGNSASANTGGGGSGGYQGGENGGNGGSGICIVVY